jgi:endoglucanase
MVDIKLLKKLSEACGVSGFEGEVREIIKKEVDKYVDKVEFDVLGNLIAFKKGIGKNRKKIALVAHMDEIGFVVKRVEKGFVEFLKVGGIDDRILPGKRVLIKTKDPSYGVIGVKPIHLLKDEERKQPVKVDDMYIDIGAKEKDKIKIEKGTQICFYSEFRQLQKNTYIGKSFDNRLGVYCLIDILKRIGKTENDIYFVFSVQEEVGLKGARTAIYNIEPDLAIIYDTTLAGDVPAVSPKETETTLGKGVGIDLIEARGAGAIMPEKLKKFILNLAKKNNIKYQLEVVEGGMTDAAITQLTKKGILAGSLCIPTRNVHTPSEIFDINDLKTAINLGKLIIKNWK